LLFQLRLAFNSEAREWDGFQPCMRDWFARHLALSVGAQFNALERLIDFVKRILFLRKQAQREIAVVRVRSGVSLMHSKSGRLAAFGP
jgi:hypothetical protein